MKDCLKLEIIDFDTLENDESNALYTHSEIIFCSDENLSAYKKIGDHLSCLTYAPYIAWNLQVYPQFKVSTVFIK